ncbi:MAG: hypothetical protein ACRYGK_03775 [Janthinobacterium lividum]
MTKITKQVPASAEAEAEPVKKLRAKPPRAGMGRPKGTPNKSTRLVKEMLLAALDKAGGVAYLLAQAKAEPKAFLILVGKLLPLQVTGLNDAPISVEYRDVTAMSDDELARIAQGKNVKPDA